MSWLAPVVDLVLAAAKAQVVAVEVILK